MPEPTEAEVTRVAGEEEIIEKKPSAPEATILMILIAVFLGLAIYLAGDEMNLYFRTRDYEAEPEKTAETYYKKFKLEFPEPAEETLRATE